MTRMVAHFRNFAVEFRRHKVLFLMLLPAILFFLIFAYLPMPGVYIAFVDYNMMKGIFGSRFVGFKNFDFLVRNGALWQITRNTLLYNLVFIVLGNLIQVVLAILISEIASKWFKKISQSVILLPYFISMVIVGVFCLQYVQFQLRLCKFAAGFLWTWKARFLRRPGDLEIYNRRL